MFFSFILREYKYVALTHIEDAQAFDDLEWGIILTKPICESRDPALELLLPNQRGPEKKISDLEVLEDFLSASNLKKADKQARKIVLEANKGNCLTAPVIRQLSLDTLRNIDCLWMQYSNDRFGLRVQQQLWQQCLEPQKPWFNLFAKPTAVSDTGAWKQFGYSVGWRDEHRRVLSDTEVNFSTEAPIGCFPQTRRWLHGGGYGNDVKQFTALVERISELG